MFKKVVVLLLLSTLALFADESLTINQEIDEVTTSFLENRPFDNEKFNKLISKIQKGSITEINAYDKLLRNYNEKYFITNSERIADIEKILTEYYKNEYRRNIIVYFANRFVFNPFLESELDYFNTNVKQFKEDTDHINYITYLYRGLKRYKTILNKTNDDWVFININLESAKQIYSISLHNDILLETYNNLKLHRKYFELQAEVYYNYEDPSFVKYLSLFFSYLAVNGYKKSFAEEKSVIIDKIKKETYDYCESLQFNNTFDEVALTNVAEKEVIINTLNENSPFYNNKLVIAFFNTTCEYCKKELSILNNFNKTLQKNEKGVQFIALNTMYNNSSTVYAETAQYQIENNISFEILIDKQSSLTSMKYRVTSVPYMLLVNEDSTIAHVVKFKQNGHLKMKLKWFLDDFLNTDL